MKKHTIESILEALKGSPTADECTRIIQACEPLRVERRDALKNITPIAGAPFDAQPAGYREAVMNDLGALGRERQGLIDEINQLDWIESVAAEAREKALAAEACKAIPAATKKLPAAADRVRAAMQALDAAISEVNGLMAAIGEYDRLPDGAYPLKDAVLAGLLRLRNDLWRPRLLNVAMPAISWDPNSSDARETWQKSWPEVFETRGGVLSPVVTTRRPPAKPPHLPDYAAPVVPIPGR